jgi:hypothetical protein
MKSTRVFAAMALLTVAATRADAQDRDPRLQRRLDPQTLVAVEAIIDSAHALGLPTEPLADKAFENAAKGRTSAQIIEQVRKRAIQLGAAQRALAPANDKEIIAGADAVASGIPVATLARLRQIRTADLAIPVSVLTDLATRGAQLDTASAIVIAMVSNKMLDNDMKKFGQVVEQDVRLGSGPTAAAMTRAEALGVSDLASAPGTNTGPVRAPTTASPKPPIKP